MQNNGKYVSTPLISDTLTRAKIKGLVVLTIAAKRESTSLL